MLDRDGYEIDDNLLKIMLSVIPSDVVIKLTNLIKLAVVTGDDLIDSELYSYIINNEEVYDNLKAYIINYIKERCNNVLKEYGISLSPEAGLDVYIGYLSTIDLISNIDPYLIETIVRITENSDLTNEEKIAKLVDDLSTVSETEAYESLEYISNSYLDNLNTKFNEYLEISNNDTSVDTESYAKDIYNLLNNNIYMKDTNVINMVVNGVEFNTDINKNNFLIYDKLDALVSDIDYEIIGAEIAGICYVYRELTDSMLNTYVTYIDDMVIGNLPINVSEKISRYVKKHIDIILNNMKD